MADQSQSKKPVLMVLILALVAAGVGTFLFLQKPPPPQAAAKEKPPQSDEMTDEERKAYIEASIEVTDLEIGAITHINSEGETVETPGLMQVKGKVHNKGDKPIKDLILVINPQDDQDKVLGTYQDTVSGKTKLQPGASREFAFQIPDKKEFSGRFLQKLK